MKILTAAKAVLKSGGTLYVMDWEVISGKNFFLVREADPMHWLPFVPSFSNFDPKFWTKTTEFAVCEQRGAVKSEARERC